MQGCWGLEAYRARADRAVAALCGVSYAALVDAAPGMDPGGMLLAQAGARGVAPGEFAAAFARLHRLATAADGDVASAERANLYRAAVIAFGGGEWGWCVGSDARAYRALPGGLVLRLDVAVAAGRLGFYVALSETPATMLKDPGDVLGRVAPPPGEFRRLGAAIDIGEALARA